MPSCDVPDPNGELCGSTDGVRTVRDDGGDLLDMCRSCRAEWPNVDLVATDGGEDIPDDGFGEVTVDEDLTAEDFPDLDGMRVDDLQAHYKTLLDYCYDRRFPNEDVEDIIFSRNLDTWDKIRTRFPETEEPECEHCGAKKWSGRPGDPPSCRGCGSHPTSVEQEEAIGDTWNTFLQSEPTPEVATDGGQDSMPSETEVVDEHGEASVETYSGGFVSAPPAYEAAHQPEPMPDPESACIECGDEAHNHRCGDCGMPICGMHNELGAGFCSDCPTEDYEPAARTDGGTTVDETDDSSGELPKTVDSWRDTHENWLGVGAAIARDDVEAFQTHADALREELDAMEATLQNRGEE